MTWTPTLISRALDLRARGFSSSEIALLIGTTRNAVVGKLWRHSNTGGARETPSAWDVKTFESYSDRKARLANEARNKTTNANA